MTFDFDRHRYEAYKKALKAAQKAKNPVLVRSIRAAMEGRDVDPFEGLSIHPEVDHLWKFDVNYPSE